ncbi:hypothetical protein BGZ60DRAFT_516907 [Tricladium varicosporioides]|nr:hypothetical protein BGZ60DRAFT_516907 [Hymenoscyphus varicosporioides]
MPLFCHKHVIHQSSNSPHVAVAPHTHLKKRKIRYLSWEVLPSFPDLSWVASKATFDKLVCLCAGRGAKYMFERKHMLEHFKALPNLTPDDLTWASRVGGEIIGERHRQASFVNPFSDPSFGITFRYRQHSEESSIVGPVSYTFMRDDTNPSPCPHDHSSCSSSSTQPSTAKITRSVSLGDGPASSKQEWLSKHTLPTLSNTSAEGNNDSSKWLVVPSRRGLNPPKLLRSVASHQLQNRVPLNRGGRPVIDLEAQVRAIRPDYDTMHDPVPIPMLDELPEPQFPIDRNRSGGIHEAFRKPVSIATSDPDDTYTPFPVFSQDWTFPKYIVMTDNHNAPAQKWLRSFKQDAILRPDTMNVAPTAGIDAHNMDDFIAARPDQNNCQQAYPAAPTQPITVPKAQGTKVKAHGNTSRPAVVRKNSAGKQIVNANAYQAEMARRANTEYEKVQVVKGRKAAPAMERIKTFKRKPPSTNPQGKWPSQAGTFAPTQGKIHQTSLLSDRRVIAKVVTTHSSAYLPKIETNYKPVAFPMYKFIRDSSKLQTEPKAIYTAAPEVVTTYDNIIVDTNLNDQTVVNAGPIFQVTTTNCALALDEAEGDNDDWDPRWMVEQSQEDD